MEGLETWQARAMTIEWPDPLKLEVKISRSDRHVLSKRDLSGITPGGYAAILITRQLLHGPRWVLVPARQLRARSYEDAELAELSGTNPEEVTRNLNAKWSDWILDESVWCKLLAQGHLNVKAGVDWCAQEHPPRVNKSPGGMRELRLAEALERFRRAVDEAHGSQSGPQQEGFIHQYLLANALDQTGCRATVNTIGVPDIYATRGGAQGRGRTVRERLEEWEPADAGLQKLREHLLTIKDDGALEALRQVIGRQAEES
jgi:hypothetical protein